MAKTFSMSRMQRVANGVMEALVKLGVPMSGTEVLTVPGRVSGEPRSVPVLPFEFGGGRYLVAPYGPVDWVKNTRAAGQVQLRRGRRVEILTAAEVSPAEAGPVLKAYVEKVKIVRPYFDSAPEAPVESFEAEATAKPVFLLAPV
jgi:deazaflavin-dependent oxidoreductase (nitroreductase family)